MGYMTNQSAGAYRVGDMTRSVMDNDGGFWDRMAAQAEMRRIKMAGLTGNPMWGRMPQNNEPLIPWHLRYKPAPPTDNLSIPTRGVQPNVTPLLDDEPTEVEQNAIDYDERYHRMGLDRADALSYLRYAPIMGSLYEMYNDDNIINADPYERLYRDTMDRARMYADPAMPPVRYDRVNPEMEAARLRSSTAQAMRTAAAMYGNRPGLAAGSVANVFNAGNEQAGIAMAKARQYNGEVQKAEDAANTQRMQEWLSRRNQAAQVNSQLESSIGSAIAQMRMEADNANRKTRFGNRQNFYKNLGLLGQDERNKWMAGVSALNGMESAGYHTPYEKP